MGNTCIPVVDSFWYLAKLIQLCKVKKIKLGKKKKKKQMNPQKEMENKETKNKTKQNKKIIILSESLLLHWYYSYKISTQLPFNYW